MWKVWVCLKRWFRNMRNSVCIMLSHKWRTWAGARLLDVEALQMLKEVRIREDANIVNFSFAWVVRVVLIRSNDACLTGLISIRIVKKRSKKLCRQMLIWKLNWMWFSSNTVPNPALIRDVASQFQKMKAVVLIYNVLSALVGCVGHVANRPKDRCTINRIQNVSKKKKQFCHQQ